MDFGDIIYYVLVVFFLILSFFNKSKKEKKAQKQLSQPTQSKPFSTRKTSTKNHSIPIPKRIWKSETLPPTPETVPPTYKRREFQSSLSLVTDFEKESSLEGSLYVNDEGMRAIFSEQTENNKSVAIHPLVTELLNNNINEELRKAVIYSEIFQRKF